MRVAIITPDQRNLAVGIVESHLRTCRGFERADVISPDRAESFCHKQPPELVIVLLADTHPELTLGLVRRLRELIAGQLLIAGPATDPKFILRAIQAGADLFLDRDELETELDAALAALRSRRAPAHRTGQLVAVLSAAGGCGASTVAVNLAALLAKEYRHCNLIDLNPGKADLAPLLDLKPQYTLADLCRNDVRLDRSMYEKLLARHSSGIDLLAAPRDFDQIGSVTPQGVAHAVAVARDSYTDVVADLEDCFHEEQFIVLEQATRILLVCRLDFLAIRNTRRILDFLTSRGIPADRVEIVVNHHGLPNELPLAEAEEAVGGKLTVFIPHDPATVGAASNMGQPMACTEPNSPVVQSIARIVGLESPTPPRVPTRVRVSNWFRNSVVPRLRSLVRRLKPAIPTPRSSAAPEELNEIHEPVNAPTVRAAGVRALSA
ncbi:AAA family ATPase [Limnoglobus roseus]|uniref:Pilus assembly protein CpaE n=1 Tax=Limnoglobus roseus TaxID=2598579 RepID=A0A5C1ATT3_9BACT|nr:hypothetical protein [Limnoglobus roseus]QEL21012.1 pilus assembly protein CpaE [Limnoglobus roseus]